MLLTDHEHNSSKDWSGGSVCSLNGEVRLVAPRERFGAVGVRSPARSHFDLLQVVLISPVSAGYLCCLLLDMLLSALFRSDLLHFVLISSHFRCVEQMRTALGKPCSAEPFRTPRRYTMLLPYQFKTH